MFTVCVSEVMQAASYLVKSLVEHRIRGLINEFGAHAAVKHLSSQGRITNHNHLQSMSGYTLDDYWVSSTTW